MTVESTGFKASDVLAGNLQKVLTDVKVDAEDSASADILNDYIRRFEQQAWFIRSQNGQA